jgi:hypothetical protein
MSNNYSIFTTELNNFSDPQRTDLFEVLFYDSTGYTYRYAATESHQFYPVKASLPRQANVIAKRWYFGTYRQYVINSDRGGETNIEFYLRSEPGKNIRLFRFLGVPIGGEFLDEEQRYKHVEFNRRFDKVEIITRSQNFKRGTVYTLYNCNVKDINFPELDARSSEALTLNVPITYDTFDVAEYDEEDRND